MSDLSFDDALILLAGTGPEFNGGLSNHGPMVCEALRRLGRPDSVGPWLHAYLPLLEKAPDRGSPLDEDEWADGLGVPRRYPDWLCFFGRELSDKPWAETVTRWVPRLVPGAMAGATHGLIRVAHATRGLSDADTGPRRDELAAGLAYWAAAYQPLPGTPMLTGTLAISAALDEVPTIPLAERQDGLISEQAARVNQLSDFPASVRALAPPQSVEESLSDLTRTMAGWYMANRKEQPIAFVHGVTAPAALRLLLPYLPPSEHATAFAYLWQTCAALRAACAVRVPQPVTQATTGTSTGDTDSVIDQAVAIGGAHAIKLTEACIRENALTASQLYLDAAEDASGRLSF